MDLLHDLAANPGLEAFIPSTCLAGDMTTSHTGAQLYLLLGSPGPEIPWDSSGGSPVPAVLGGSWAGMPGGPAQGLATSRVGRGGPACPVLPTEPPSLYFEPNNMDFVVRVWTILRSPHKHYPLLLTLAPFLSSFWTVFVSLYSKCKL